MPVAKRQQTEKPTNRPDDDRRQSYGMPLDRSTRQDLRLMIVSIVFGIVYSVITGYPGSSPLFTAYLKQQLGISDSAYGLIMTIPYLTVLIQVPFSVYVTRHGRLKQSFLVFGLLAKSMIFIPAILTLTRPGLHGSAAVWIIGAVIFMTSLFNWIADSSLNTWFGAMIPNEIKGRYFSTRQMLFTLAMLAYAIVISLLLQLTADYPGKYAVFFTAAGLFGIIDICLYTGVRPPEKAYRPWFHTSQARQSLASFTAPLRHKRYRAYLLFAIFWNFSLQISGPFFNVYLLNHLHVSLGMMTLQTQIIPAAATVLFLRKVGRAFDRYGFRPVLILACSMAMILPFVWLLATPESYWFIFPLNILVGIFNIGIEMAIMSLAIFLAPHDQRSTFLAVKNVLMALLGIVPAILLGGALSDWLEPILAQARWPFIRGQQLNTFHILLFLSLLMRLLTLVVFARGLREPDAHSFQDFIQEARADGRLAFAQMRDRQQDMLRTVRQRLHRHSNQ